jgi:hypothetical protein
MSLVTLAWIAQIALFGAAGTMFIQSFLSMQAARRAGGREYQGRGDAVTAWRLWRHPHLAAHTSPADRAEARRIGMMMLWGVAFLGAALGLQAWTLAAAARVI